ncbi:MAG TPA: hypothetical protein VJ787_11190 [Thermoleophilia bacterium]|nr:hypothetical protein [Thermoleophilia bacterium]
MSGRRLLGFAVAVTLAALAAWGMLPQAASAQTNKENERCFSCHADMKGTVTADGDQASLRVPPHVYGSSVHSQLDCTSCHPSFKAGEHTPAETESWYREATLTSCTNCHADVASMYEGSFHGDLVMSEGATNAPTCGDCHGSHGIAKTDTREFRVSTMGMCSRCHGGRTTTYLDVYHGKAFLLGNDDSAVCTDCHGSHKILPVSDPESMVSEQNIVATCASCHPGANEQFATYLVHVDPSSPSSSFTVWLFYAAYFLLIAVIFTFGAVHSTLFVYRGRKEGMYRRGSD